MGLRATWEALTDGPRERNLFFGTRPLATVMRPRFLTQQQYELLQRGVELVVAALQRLGDALLADAALLPHCADAAGRGAPGARSRLSAA